MDISKVFDVSLGEIEVKNSNVRSDLESQNSQDNLAELAENIKINGLLQPIVLRGVHGKPPYDVIVGQRRFLAHKLLKWGSIQATFSDESDDMKVLLLSLSENMCRQEMNFQDTSDAITKLYNHYAKNEYKVREHTGFSIQKIRSYIKIEEQATEKIKQLLAGHSISLTDAKRAIDASQGDNKKADLLIDEIVKLTTYEKKRLLETSSKKPSATVDELVKEAKKPKWEETIILNLSSEISEALKKATAQLSVDPEKLAMDALVNWLKTNDFLIESTNG